MAFQLYKQFLAAPSASLLSEDATLHYVTTLTSIHEAPAIQNHLSAQAKQLRKREEKILNSVEGNDSLVCEVETTLELISGGGAYLPGLDDNFLADHTVTLPIIHIVDLDANSRIRQIRLHWDQASLLKMVDVIGARAKNWPISSGVDQIRLIMTAKKALGIKEARNPDEVIISQRVSQPTNATGDPHASLSLFAPRDQDEKSRETSAVASRASSKPPGREYNELFNGNDSAFSPPTPTKTSHGQVAPTPIAAKVGSGKNHFNNRLFGDDSTQSEKKAPAYKSHPNKYNHFNIGPESGAETTEISVAPKGAGNMNYQPSRLFDNDSHTQTQKKEPAYQSHPKKYEHFQMAAENDAQARPSSPTKGQSPVKQHSKHLSNWSFEDFATPAKPQNKIRGQDVRHFAIEDSAVDATPVMVKKMDKPRRDAETHFEFKDDGTPQGEKRGTGRPKGGEHRPGLALYESHLYEDENGNGKEKSSQPLANVTNAQNHRKHFGSQFVMSDDSPATKDKVARPIADDRKQAAHSAFKSQESSWDTYDRSEAQIKTMKENMTENVNRSGTGILTAGDGMGGRKGTGRSWGFGDDSDEEASTRGSRNIPGKKQHARAATAGNDFWDVS